MKVRQPKKEFSQPGRIHPKDLVVSPISSSTGHPGQVVFVTKTEGPNYTDTSTGYLDSSSSSTASLVTSSCIANESWPVMVRSIDEIESAVYGYIQAIRVLGKTEINTLEIAAALSLSVKEINSVLDRLKTKGVVTKTLIC